MIEILNYEKVGRNKIIGYVDVKLIINGISMIIRKVVHFQSGDKKWFNLPAFKEERNGNTKFFRYWQFEADGHNTKFLNVLTDKVKEYCDKHGIKEFETLNFDDKMVPIEEVPF